MAVTALSGQRWQGLNDGATTPTVANSVFLVDSPTWQEADDISYNSGTDKIDFSADGSSIVDSYATFDLQATSALGSGNNASDTEWVLRFKLDLTNYDPADSSSSALVVGISNQGTSVGSASQNGIGFEVGCGTPHDTLYRLQTANGASWARGSADATFTETPADDEITYVEVKRTSASAVTVNLYSDSEYSTLLESKSITGMSGTTGLRYVAVKSDTQSQPNNRLIGTVSEINFWNDTTSATGAERDSVTDVPVGSEFEQTDDYKSYQLASGGAVKFDSQVYTTTTTTADPATLSEDITIADNDDRILIVSAGAYNASPTISGITFDSTPLVKINSQLIVGIDNGRCDLWYLSNPDAITGTIEVTWSGSAGRRGFGAISFYNVKQSGTDGADGIAQNVPLYSATQESTIEGTITPTIAGSAIVDGMLWLTGASPSTTLTDGFAVNITDPGSADRAVGMQYDLSPTIDSANAMEYTSSEASRYAWIGAELVCEDLSLGKVWVERGTAI